MPRPTLKDVATAAGVSIATVSRALSGSRGVRPEHKDAVLKAAAELRYRIDPIGRALRNSRSGAIGMVVPRIDNPFFPQLLREAEHRLREKGYTLLICSSDEDPAIEAERLMVLADRRVDGILISACSQVSSAVALADLAREVPLVQFDQYAPGVGTPFVGVDDAQGIRAVVDLLAMHGRRSLAFIGASDDNWSGMRRRLGFETWAAELDPRALARIEIGEFTRAFGEEAGRRMLQRFPEIDAIVCANDLIALGVIDAARDAGWDVPGRLAVTGFDDVNIATVARPTLTTVRQPVEELIGRATSALLALIEGADFDEFTELPLELVERESTGRVVTEGRR